MVTNNIDVSVTTALIKQVPSQGDKNESASSALRRWRFPEVNLEWVSTRSGFTVSLETYLTADSALATIHTLRWWTSGIDIVNGE